MLSVVGCKKCGTDLLQAVILWQSPCVSIAVNGDLHGGSLAHNTVCHHLISARHNRMGTGLGGLTQNRSDRSLLTLISEAADVADQQAPA